MYCQAGFLLEYIGSHVDSSFITVKLQPSNNYHNELRRPRVKQMITIDNQGVNMNLINESIISLPSLWPLATLLIKPSAGTAVHRPRAWCLSVLNSLTDWPPQSWFFSLYFLTCWNSNKVSFVNKTLLQNTLNHWSICRNTEKLGWKAKDEHCHIFTRRLCHEPHRSKDGVGPALKELTNEYS